MGKIKDLTGKNFNRIEVLSFVEIKNHSAMWKCKCSCGNLFITRGADLSNGHTAGGIVYETAMMNMKTSDDIIDNTIDPNGVG